MNVFIPSRLSLSLEIYFLNWSISFSFLNVGFNEYFLVVNSQWNNSVCILFTLLMIFIALLPINSYQNQSKFVCCWWVLCSLRSFHLLTCFSSNIWTSLVKTLSTEFASLNVMKPKPLQRTKSIHWINHQYQFGEPRSFGNCIFHNHTFGYFTKLSKIIFKIFLKKNRSSFIDSFKDILPGAVCHESPPTNIFLNITMWNCSNRIMKRIYLSNGLGESDPSSSSSDWPSSSSSPPYGIWLKRQDKMISIGTYSNPFLPVSIEQIWHVWQREKVFLEEKFCWLEEVNIRVLSSPVKSKFAAIYDSIRISTTIDSMPTCMKRFPITIREKVKSQIIKKHIHQSKCNWSIYYMTLARDFCWPSLKKILDDPNDYIDVWPYLLSLSRFLDQSNISRQTRFLLNLCISCWHVRRKW